MKKYKDSLIHAVAYVLVAFPFEKVEIKIACNNICIKAFYDYNYKENIHSL